MIVFLVRPVKYLSRESRKLTVMIGESGSTIQGLSVILQIVRDLCRVIRGAGLLTSHVAKAPHSGLSFMQQGAST